MKRLVGFIKNMHSSNKKNAKIANLLLISLVVASFVLTYYPVLKNLWFSWSSSEENSHGFLIIPICIYIVWQKKDLVSKISDTSSIFGLIIVISSLLLYIIASFSEILTISSISMVFMIAGTVIYIYGLRVFKELLFPIFFLFFMIPIPAQIYSSLTIPLQLIVTKASVFLATNIGIPVLKEGNVIQLPAQTLEVVRACSGLRSLVSLLTLSVVFSYFTLNLNILRGILFLSGIPTAIAVNICRVTFMIVFFYYFDVDLTQGATHTIFGVIIFVFAILIIAGIRGVLCFWDKPLIKRS